MRHLTLLCAPFLLSTALVPPIDEEHQESPARHRIGVLFWHDSANDRQTFQGFREGLKAAGLEVAIDLVRGARKEERVRAALARWRRESRDLVVTMGTRATQLARHELTRIPILFAAVTNPRSAGLPPPGTCDPEGNITGASSWLLPRYLLREFRHAMPGLERLGVLHDPTNQVSAAQIRGVKEFLAGTKGGHKASPPWVKDLRRNLDLVEGPVRSRGELRRATEQLALSCDAIWIPTDFLVYQNLDRVAAAADPLAKPLFTSSLKGMDRVVLGVTVDFRLLGLKAAAAAMQILQDKKPPGRIPVSTLASHRLVVNLTAARRIGLKVPLQVLCRAEEIIDGSTQE